LSLTGTLDSPIIYAINCLILLVLCFLYSLISRPPFRQSQPRPFSPIDTPLVVTDKKTAHSTSTHTNRLSQGHPSILCSSLQPPRALSLDCADTKVYELRKRSHDTPACTEVNKSRSSDAASCRIRRQNNSRNSFCLETNIQA
jgi:hypothetical protein